MRTRPRTTSSSGERAKARDTALMALLLGALVLLVALLGPQGSAHAGEFWDAQRTTPRVKRIAGQRDTLRAAFRQAGAAWPPRIFLRAYKQERTLELWAAPRGRETRWIKVEDIPLCATSGRLGPKVKRGDLQMPEGRYHIDRFNPYSRFHLSLGLNYPNAEDRARTPKGVSPGDDIFIHGGCVTIGCLPLGDPAMERLYLVAVTAKDHGQRQIPVEIHPCRHGTPTCEAERANPAHAEHLPLWDQLNERQEAFELTGRP